MKTNLWQLMLPRHGIVQRHLPVLNSHLRDINPKLNLFVICGKKFQYLLVLNSIRLCSTSLTIPCVGQCYWPRKRNINSYPHSIDETPRFVGQPVFWNSAHCALHQTIGDSVTYLARLQSVTQNSEKGLNLKAYVKLDTKQWLRMYSRIRHACEIAACIHLPDPVMLTAAAMVRSDSDLFC